MWLTVFGQQISECKNVFWSRPNKMPQIMNYRLATKWPILAGRGWRHVVLNALLPCRHFFEGLLRLLPITAPAFCALLSQSCHWIWNAVWYLNEPIPHSWTWDGYKIKASQEGAEEGGTGQNASPKSKIVHTETWIPPIYEVLVSFPDIRFCMYSAKASWLNFTWNEGN